MVTGNIRGAAEVKLATFGLDTYLRLDDGAYGEDGEERSELLLAALARADVPAADAVFLGHTPADVTGGRDAGVRVVAVATGKTTRAALQEAGAEAVLDELADTGRVLNAIGA